MSLTPFRTGSRTLFRLAGPLLQTLATPHDLDRYLEQVHPLWSLSETRARVVGLRRETADCVTLTLRPNAHWRGHRAGQYVRVGVEIDGVRRTRCYSISSAPGRRDGCFTITVKQQDGGRVSAFLASPAAAGQVLTLSQAEGDFCVSPLASSRLLFISGGSGITPVMSMLRSLLGGGHNGEITLLHYARHPADAIFGEELSMLARTHPNLRLLPLYTRASLLGPASGHFTPAQLREAVPGYADCETYVCGPATLIAAVEQLWTREGRAAQLHVERFVAATSAQPADGIASGELRFVRSERYAANDGRTLLDQAEGAGLRPESGCRMGICHSCTCRKASGTVRNLRTGAVSSEAGEDIQLCISVAVGDVTLDL